MGRVRGVGIGVLFGVLGCYAGVPSGDSDAAQTEDGTGSTGATASQGSAASAGAGSNATASSDSASAGTSTTGDDTSPTDPSSAEGPSSTGEIDDDGSDDADVEPPPQGCSAGGAEIVAAINAVRADNGLPAIALSSSMCEVAATHNQDLAAHAPHAPADCNLHSWSNQGPWSACCYTSDHAQAQCMWDKPGELTVYPGNGYEVSAAGGGLTPQSAVDLWLGSPGHRAVLLSEGAWADPPWLALGADIQDGFAAAWFGHQVDPAE